MSKELDVWMKKHPRTHAFPDSLIPAVEETESANIENTVSPAGAVGPMQIVTSAHNLRDSDVADPKINREVGVRYLDKLYKQFDGDVVRTLRAYNQGPGNERKEPEDYTPTVEAQQYPNKVIYRDESRKNDTEASFEQWKKDHPVRVPQEMKQWEAKYPVLEAFGKGAKAVMDFAEKPFGYENPPVSFLLDITGVRSIPKTAEMLAYGDRLTTGKGETLHVKDDVLDTALLAAPVAGRAMKAMKGKPVGLSIKAIEDAPIRSLAEVMKDEPYTLKSIEGLVNRSGKKGMISVQAIKDELNRPGISKAEKDILTPFTAQDGAVKAEDLVQGMKASTKDFRLTAHTHDQWADYGLDNIGRGGTLDWIPEVESRAAKDIAGAPARTTTWRLPDDVSGNMGNHFKDPEYFGHTRAFEENGIPHVVEVQSDLMQNKKLVGPKRDEAEAEFNKIRDGIPDLRKKISDGHNAIQEARDALYKSGSSAESDRLIEKIHGLKAEMNGLPTIQSQQLKRDELLAKLTAGNTEKDIEPMRKTHVERLVKEELSLADQNGRSVVRFADPDTVAKVESWPDIVGSISARLKRLEGHVAKIKETNPQETTLPQWEKEIAAAKKNLADLRPNQLKLAEETRDRHVEQVAARKRLHAANPDLMDSRPLREARIEKTNLLEEEIKSDELEVSHFKKHLKDPIDSPLFSRQHHGIYDNYKDMEKYLKSIGGIDYVDTHGHRWIEVPVKGAKSPVKSGRVPMFSITGAAAPVGYNAVNEEPSK
jgi:hypothetical protein